MNKITYHNVRHNILKRKVFVLYDIYVFTIIRHIYDNMYPGGSLRNENVVPAQEIF